MFPSKLVFEFSPYKRLRRIFVYRLVTSIENKIALCGTSVITLNSIQLSLSVTESLRYDFCVLAIS